jgi:hypothetical protein
MSTTSSHGVRAAQRPPSQFACTLAPVEQLSPAPAQSRGCIAARQVRRPLAALTNGTVCPNAKCCAGLCKVSSPARRAPCQSPIAWQSPVPNPSEPKPSLPATRSPQRPRTSGFEPHGSPHFSQHTKHCLKHRLLLDQFGELCHQRYELFLGHVGDQVIEHCSLPQQ